MPGNVSVPVYSGLVPIDVRVTGAVPAKELTTYFTTWTASLLANGKFATRSTIAGCDDDECLAFFLPGGLETTRQAYSSLNYSIFAGGMLDAAKTIRIENAPGIVITFEDIRGFEFDWQKECVYPLQPNNDSVQICSRQVDKSILVGKQ